MAEQTEPADIAALFTEVRDRGWAAVLQLGDFDEEGVDGTATRFSAFVYVPFPSRRGHHSDDEAIQWDNLDWEDASEPYYAEGATPAEAFASAMKAANQQWEWRVKDCAELRAENRESDAFSATAGATT